MIKRLLKATAMLTTLVCGSPLLGQAGDYSFAVSSATFTPITGGTDVDAIEADYAISSVIPIGFTFVFDGISYTDVRAGSDGFLSFSATASAGTANDLDAGPANRRPLVAPLWDDHAGSVSASSSQASYVVTGTAPNRVFTFEWLNWEWNYGATDSVVSFQVKLYETTNEVQFTYKWEDYGSINSPSASIGLSGVSTFLSVTDIDTGTPTVSNTAEDSGIDTIVTDQVFTFTPPLCPSPAFLSFTNVKTDSISINWVGNGSGPWYIYWGPVGFDQASSGVSLDTSATTSFTAHGLTASTGYSFYIKEDCGGGDTSFYAGPFNQTTVYAPPYLETFANGYPGADYTEAVGAIANPTTFTSTSSNWKEDGFSNAGTTGATSINLYGTSRRDWFVGPSIDLGDGTTNYQIEFDASVTDWNGTGPDAMGVDDTVMLVISTDNGATWNRSDALMLLSASSNIPNGQGMHFVANLAGYTGIVKFGFYAESTVSNTDYDFHIDNIEVRIPPACPDPTFLSSTQYGVDSVVLSWAGSAGAFNYSYGPAPNLPGAGSTGSVTDTFVVLTGLTASTEFEFNVQSSCSGGSTFSAYVSTAFTTPCAPVIAPYTENFDGASWITGTSGGFGDTIDGCWNRNSNSGYKWSVYNGTTSSSSTGPDMDNTTGTGNFLYTEASSTTPSLAQLVSPYVDVSALTTPYVSFWYHRYGTTANMGDMVLEINDGNGWDTLLLQTGVTQTSGAAPFLNIGADISAYGDTVQIRFTSAAKTCCSGDMAIDDFMIDEAPTCLPMLSSNVGDVVDTAATFYWDETATATSYQVWFGPQGFYQGTATLGGTKVVVSNDTLVVDTLSDLTCYEYVVKGICGPGDSTAWFGSVSFCTPPSCPQPTALGVDNGQLTINSADVYWTTGGSSNFNVEYGPIGFTPGSGTMVNSANDTLSLTGLTDGTGYEFYVRDSCGQGDVSQWTGPFSFVTAFTTNYLEDFSSVAGPFAWLPATGKLTANTNFTSTTSTNWGLDNFGNSGSQSMRVNLYTSNQFGWAITPSIYLDPSINNLQLEFDVSISQYNSNSQGYLDGTDDTVAVVISTDNGDTWTNTGILWYTDEDDTIDVAGEHIIVPLTGYTGYVRFGLYGGSVVSDSKDNDIYIDNFEVRTPRACTPPTALNVSEIKSDSALVYWTEGTPGFINAEVIYTVGNQPATAGQVVNSTNDSVYLTGLSNATNYCVYVVEQCINGYSDTVGPVCFTTLCLPQSLPYFENFNASLGCFIPVDGGNSTHTWEQVVDYTDFTGTHTLDGTPFAFVNSDGAGSGNNLVELLESVQIDASNITGPLILEYDQHYLTYIGNDSAIVEVFDGTNWVKVAGYGATVGSWSAPVHDSIDISAYANANLQVRFSYDDDNTWAYYWAVDNVSIMEASSCPTPAGVAVANISCDSVEVSWTSDATATGSYIEYGAKGFALGSGTVIANAASPQTINGLMMNTEYDVYVVDSCAMVGSNPSAAVTFKTDSVGPVHASFTAIQTSATLTDGMVDVDASASSGDGLTYAWDFGNSTTGTGATTQGTYTANGTFSIVLTVTDRCGNTDDTTVVVTVTDISVAENAYNAGIEMYPNPNNGRFNVNVTNGSGTYAIEVVDLSGRVVYHKGNITPGTAHEVQLQNKAKGVYMVRLKGEGLNATQRIVID